MKTDRPTIDLHFVLGYTYCKLCIFPEQEQFIRDVLVHSGVREWLAPNASEEWQEISTQVLLAFVHTALPEMLERRMRQALRELAL